LRHTFSDTVNKAKPLVDTDERLLKTSHVFLDRFFNLFVAAVYRVPALIEWIHAFVQCLFSVFLFDVVLMHIDMLPVAQRDASLGHDSVAVDIVLVSVYALADANLLDM
jgi:hypothetical protein